MQHPTPSEIARAINVALADDYAKHPQGGDVPFIPVRVHSIVSEAISKACRDKDSEQ